MLMAQIFIRLFSITGPLSRYLQTQGFDLLKCNSMVQTALKQLESMQRDADQILNSTRDFVSWAQIELDKNEIDIIIEADFRPLRQRKVKTFFDERATDEQPQIPYDRFRVSTFNVLLDTAITSMKNRFCPNMNLCRDLAALDPRSFEEIVNDCPQNCMEFLAKHICKFNPSATPENLKNELQNFAANWPTLRQTLSESYQITYNDVGSDSETEILCDIDDDIRQTDDIDKEPSKRQCPKTCRNCCICCYAILLKYNMYQGTYPSLFTAYQFLLTLPVTQVACERSFSILKYIKNRLRNRLTDHRLESLMMMNVEKQCLNNLHNEQIINALAKKSSLLSKALLQS